MANNVNTNLTQRIFAYISHSSDLNDRLAQVYENSLIFVGDEQQIYVPKFGAYVGVGMTSYNNIMGRVDDVLSQLAEFKKTMNETAVKKLYVDYGTATTIDGQEYGGKFLSENIAGAKSINPDYLSGSVVITGSYDVNLETFLKNDTHYAYNAATGNWEAIQTQQPDQMRAPTSGIRISYTSDWTYVTLDGGVISKVPTDQRLVIDDSATWAYMTNAYSYTLGFTRKYTDYRIESLYHDIIGDSRYVLMPIPRESMYTIDPQGNEQLIIDNYYYWDNENNVPDLSPFEDIDDMPAGWKPASASHIAQHQNTQYYKISSVYNNSYNMNISDGIQTLKEIAYILDQITDGGLGSVTYLTESQWNDITGISEATVNNNAYTIANNPVTYHRVMVNGVPTINPNSYGWYIAVDPENIGIQMANSIAGNTAAIADLHDHVLLAESGNTTLRSLSQYSPSQFMTVTQWSNREGLSVTDTQQSLPEKKNIADQTDYNIGDVASMSTLIVASTYITYNGSVENSGLSSSSLNGEEHYGIYQLVDITQFPEFAENTYYRYNGSSMELVGANEDWPVKSNPESLYQYNSGTTTYELKKFYYINSLSELNSYAYANDVFSIASLDYIANNPNNIYYTLGSNNRYAYADFSSDSPNPNEDYYYVKPADRGQDYVLHAVTNDPSNKLATTAWTIALVNDKNTNLQNKLTNILVEANTYTDKRIKMLDANYAYSDFAAYFNSLSQAASLTYGTAAWQSLWDEQYDAWTRTVSHYSFADPNTNDKFVDGAYTYNTVRSHYLFNVTETDGIVHAESRELPTDELNLSYTIWNNRTSSESFAEIDGTDIINDSTNASEALQKLFAFASGIVEENGVYSYTGQKEIYYHPDGATTYVAYMNNVGDEIPANLVYLDNDGIYHQISNEILTTYAIKYCITNSPHHPGKLYKVDDAYYEVDVTSINVQYDNSLSAYTISSFSYVDPTSSTGYGVVNNDNSPKFYYKQVNESDSVKYLSGKVEHCSFDVDGHGENRFFIDAHITHIEDAKPTNTGLADAYDVQNYIQNMFSWVNISASINEEVLTQESDFYTVFSTKDLSSVAGLSLYYKETSTDTFSPLVIDNTNTMIINFAKNESGKLLYSFNGTDWRNSNDGTQYNGTDVVQSSIWTEVAHKTSNNPEKWEPLTVYERTQDVFTNPLNMTLHKV